MADETAPAPAQRAPDLVVEVGVLSAALPKAPGAVSGLLTRIAVSPSCPPWVARRIRATAMRDPAWRAHYDALRRVERALSGSAVGRNQGDLVEQLLFAELDAVDAVDAVTATAHTRPRPARALFSLGGFAGAAAAVFLFFVVGRAPAQLQDRGGASVDAPRLGVRARCVDAAAHRVLAEAEAGPRMASDSLVCPRTALLSLSLTNLEAAPFHVFVVGVNGVGELRFIAPFDEGARSRAVAPGTVDEPLPTLADLSTLPVDTGDVTLFALFAREPLAGDEVARVLKSERARGVGVHALARLPFDAYTARIELRAPASAGAQP